MSAATVKITGLEKRFGSVVALGGIDLELAPGVNGLLGPNGAGKTTLLRILATVMRADAGWVEAYGCDPSTGDGRLALRRRLGYLPQEPGYHRQFTAFDFVDYVAILKEWADRRPRRRSFLPPASPPRRSPAARTRSSAPAKTPSCRPPRG